MRWTRFADESRAKSLENAIRLHENLQEPMRRIRIIGCVDAIVREAESVGHLHGHRQDLHLDAERLQHRHVFVIEVGDGSGYERDRSNVSVARPRDQLVSGEVEADVEGAPIIWYGRCGQPTFGDVQHDLPPVVLHRGQRQPGLADDLRPAMERRLGGGPLIESEARPRPRVEHRLCLDHT